MTPNYSRITDDEDLSGCLASQPAKAKKPIAEKIDDEDLSGCLLSAPLAPKKTIADKTSHRSPLAQATGAEPRRKSYGRPSGTRSVAFGNSKLSNFTPIESDDISGEIQLSGDIEPSTGLGSDWLYLN
jgi:hypothetical protein